MSTTNFIECIANDELYAYLAGELLPEREAIVEAHLAQCDRCLAALNSDDLIILPVENAVESAVLDDIYQQTLVKSRALWPSAIVASNTTVASDLAATSVGSANLGSANLNSSTPVPSPMPTLPKRSFAVMANWQSSARWVAIAALVIICFTSAVFYNRSTRVDPVAQARSILQASMHRPTEFRLAAANYAPYVKERGKPAELQLNQLRSAQANLQASVEIEAQPSTQQLLAQIALATGDFDLALEQLLKINAPNAKIYNDLAVVYIEKGQTTLALQYLTQALMQDRGYLEALFNRALLHQQLRHQVEAKQDWQAYLALETTADWAREAHNYLERLDE
jgi:anti-sigma factor RsiW